jgi:hypothetical protein
MRAQKMKLTNDSSVARASTRSQRTTRRRRGSVVRAEAEQLLDTAPRNPLASLSLSLLSLLHLLVCFLLLLLYLLCLSIPLFRFNLVLILRSLTHTHTHSIVDSVEPLDEAPPPEPEKELVRIMLFAIG